MKDNRLSCGHSSRCPAQRRRRFRSGVKDVGRIFAVACVLDTIYQLFVLREFHIGQLLIVAVACAVVPYGLVRGPVTLLASLFYRNRARSAGGPTLDTEHCNQEETLSLLCRNLAIPIKTEPISPTPAHRMGRLQESTHD